MKTPLTFLVPSNSLISFLLLVTSETVQNSGIAVGFAVRNEEYNFSILNLDNPFLIRNTVLLKKYLTPLNKLGWPSTKSSDYRRVRDCRQILLALLSDFKLFDYSYSSWYHQKTIDFWKIPEKNRKLLIRLNSLHISIEIWRRLLLLLSNLLWKGKFQQLCTLHYFTHNLLKKYVEKISDTSLDLCLGWFRKLWH